MFIDSRLSFDKQVSCICRASYSNIKALRKIRSTLDLETAKTVACAIVSARLNYCNSILYGTSIANINKLQRVHNSLARVVSGSELSTGRMDPRVGSGRVGSGRVGSGRVTILPDFGGSGRVSTLDLLAFLLIISWYLNRYESSNTTFGLIDFHRYSLYDNYLIKN